MANPWLKKNPFMSAWLSGANAVAGSARGHATAQAKRNASTAIRAGANEWAKLWTSAATMPKPAKRKRK